METTTPSEISSDFINPIHPHSVPRRMVPSILIEVHHLDEDEEISAAKKAAVEILTAIGTKFGTTVITSIEDVVEAMSKIEIEEQTVPGHLLADLATTVGVIRADHRSEGWRYKLLANYGELLRGGGEFTLTTAVKVLDTVRAMAFASARDVRERLRYCGQRARLFAGVDWPAPVDRRSAMLTGGDFSFRDAGGHDARDSR